MKIKILLLLASFSFGAFAGPASMDSLSGEYPRICDYILNAIVPNATLNWPAHLIEKRLDLKFQEIHSQYTPAQQAKIAKIVAKNARPETGSTSQTRILAWCKAGFVEEGIEGVVIKQTVQPGDETQDILDKNTAVIATKALGKVPQLSIESLKAKATCFTKSQGCEEQSPIRFSFLTAEIEEYLNIEDNKTPEGDKAYDDEDCDCKMSNLEKSVSLQTPEFSDKVELEKEKIVKVLRAAANRKFVNEYAALYEDLKYNSKIEEWFFLGKTYTKKEMLCADTNEFKKEVSDLCRQNGTSEGSIERMSEALASMDPSLANKSFEDGFQALNDDIRVLKIPAGVLSNRKPLTFYRDSYDLMRKAFQESSPTVRFANKLMTAMMQNKKLKKNVNVNLKGNKTPYYGILDSLKNPNSSLEIEKTFDLLAKQHHPFFAELLNLKKTDQEKYHQAIIKLFHEAINTSPIIKNLLLNQELFSHTVDKFRPKEDSLFGLYGVVESEATFLRESYRKRCKAVQKNLAISVCSKNEDILKNSSADDVSVLLEKDKRFLPNSDQNVVDKAICDFRSNKPEKNSFFSDMLFRNGNPYKVSDYADRKYSTAQDIGQMNPFFDMAETASDEKYKNQFQKALQATVNTGKSIDKYRSAPSSSSDGSVLSFAKTPVKTDLPHSSDLASFVAPETGAPLSREPASVSHVKDESNERTFETQAPAAAAPAFMAPIGQTANTVLEETKSVETSERVIREKLASELAGSENKNRVKEHINSVNEEDAQEIFKLRDQALKDRQTISDLRLQQEIDKTEALRGEYEQLKSRYDGLEKEHAPVVAKEQVVSSGFTTSSSTGGMPNFESSSFVAPVAGGGTTGGRNSGNTALNIPASSASLSDSSAGSSSAAAVRNTPVSTTGSTESSRGLALTVTQTTGPDGKVASYEDPNKALITYLNKNEPSVQQLQELKTSGLVLTEEDVAKDGQKVFKKKVVKFNELSQEVKALVEKKLASIKLQEVKRNYSRQALILELFTASMKKSNLNVKKTGSLNF